MYYIMLRPAELQEGGRRHRVVAPRRLAGPALADGVPSRARGPDDRGVAGAGPGPAGAALGLDQLCDLGRHARVCGLGARAHGPLQGSGGLLLLGQELRRQLPLELRLLRAALGVPREGWPRQRGLRGRARRRLPSRRACGGWPWRSEAARRGEAACGS